MSWDTVGIRFCDVCGVEIVPSSKERPSQYALRTKCGHACVVRAHSQKTWERRPQRTCPICKKEYRSATPSRFNATCGDDTCKKRYKREIAAAKQSETVKRQYAEGRKASAGISPRERLLWPLLIEQGWAWRLRWEDAWGPFEIDFAHMDAKVAIEIDGPEHRHPSRRVRDEGRDAELERRGWRVYRFTNEAVDESPERVAAEISNCLA